MIFFPIFPIIAQNLNFSRLLLPNAKDLNFLRRPGYIDYQDRVARRLR